MAFSQGADYPHIYANGSTVGCGKCHWIAGMTPPWNTIAVSLDPLDNTINNRRCLTCHDGTVSEIAKPHSSATLGSIYWATQGGWTTQCITCHEPHHQRQTRRWRSESYIATGGTPVISWDTGNVSTTLALPNILDDDYTGYYILPDRDYPVFYKIMAPEDTTGASVIQVKGYVAGQLVKSGGFAIIYARNIKDALSYTNPGGQTANPSVKLFGPAGTNSFVDSPNLSTGICAVCHTRTTHFRSDGQGPDQLHSSLATGIPGVDCDACHTHISGFKPVRGCDGCHGNPPADNATLVFDPSSTGSTTAGAHAKHSTGGANYSYACNTCHYGGMPATRISGNNRLQIGFSFLSHSGGSYGGHALNAPYRYQGTNGTRVIQDNSWRCASIYCHGNYPGSGRNASPIWTSASTAACESCHAASNTTPPASGSHTLHASSAYPNIPCTLCHNSFVSGSGPAGYAVSDRSAHANGYVNWKFDTSDPRLSESSAYSIASGTAVPSNGSIPRGYGSCSNIYCHSSAQGITDPTQPPVYVAPVWGELYPSGVCGSGACHAVGNAHLGDTGYAPLTSGSHEKHLRYKFDQDGNCQVCHYDPSFGGCTGCHQRRANHVNYSIDVTFKPDFPWVGGGESGTYTGSPEPRTPYGGCSDLYCHSQGTASSPPYSSSNTPSYMWGSTLASDCTGCHNGDRNTATPMATGSHGKHVSNYSYNCSFCHISTVSDSRTLNPGIYFGTQTLGYRHHSNGWINVAFVSTIASNGTYAGQTSPVNMKAPGSSYGSCGNIYCHSDGTGGTANIGTQPPVSDPRTIATNTSATWGTAGSQPCNSCHGSTAYGDWRDSMPQYTSGEPKANSHLLHVNFPCNYCHYATTTTGTTITSPGKHANRIYDVVPDTTRTYNLQPVNFTYTYDAGGGTCSSNNCHLDRQWGTL